MVDTFDIDDPDEIVAAAHHLASVAAAIAGQVSDTVRGLDLPRKPVSPLDRALVAATHTYVSTPLEGAASALRADSAATGDRVAEIAPVYRVVDDTGATAIGRAGRPIRWTYGT
ncbi:hypothetical protein ACIRRA_37510 [Nocardia sp. NPDC101769]|uniref:hypothetical protein n=1 Tax=Nocardia sp. NPDC101769 TaxID=3364333 RepID=UPI00382A65D0